MGERLFPEELIVIHAQYQENGTARVGSKEVVVFVEGTISDLVRRNITGAISLKMEILDKLEAALRKERAAKEVSKQLRIPASTQSTGTAINLEEASKKLIIRSIDHLDKSLEGLDQ